MGYLSPTLAVRDMKKTIEYYTDFLGFKLGTGVNLYMQIDGNLDAYYDEVKEKGVKITADIKDEPFGIRDFTIEDINGYQFTFNAPIG